LWFILLVCKQLSSLEKGKFCDPGNYGLGIAILTDMKLKMNYLAYNGTTEHGFESGNMDKDITFIII